MGPFKNNITPYLFFNGNCREAMGFYKSMFGGDLTVMTYGEGPNCPTGAKDKVMHASLISPEIAILASDTPDDELNGGASIYLSLNCKDSAHVDATFKTLAEKGEVIVAPHDAFWGSRFAMVTDRFGISWMLNHEHGKK